MFFIDRPPSPTSVSAASAPPSTSDQRGSIDQAGAPGVSSGTPAASSSDTVEPDDPHLHQEPANEEVV